MSLKFGKKPARTDPRDIRYSSVAITRPVPDAWNWDEAHPGLPLPMFANDQYGDCVIAGRAHQTLRFGMIGSWGQSRLLPITDEHVVTEYFRQSGGADEGLLVLNSLNEWRTTGWEIDGQRLHIYGYTRIHPHDRDSLRHAIYYLTGAGCGILMSAQAMEQYCAGRPWDATPGVEYAITGGHYVYLVGYDREGLTCVTWGSHHRMTWAFWDTFADEAYGIIGHPGSSGVDFDALDAMIREVTT